MADEADEALRRRLYGPDASPADVERYREARPTAPADTEPEPAVASERSRSRRPPRWAVLVALALVVVAVVGVALILRPAPAAVPTSVAIDGATRQGFVEDLRGGGAAGLAAYLVTHPSPRGMRGATRFDTLEVHGTGTATLPLGTPAPGTDRGRATVLVVAGSTADLTWTAQSADGRDLDSRGGTLLPGELTTATFRYAVGSRPVRVAVSAPAGVRWGVAVVYSD